MKIKVITFGLFFVLLYRGFANVPSAHSFSLNLLHGLQKTTKVKTKSQNINLDTNYFKGYVSDTKNILTSPLRWEKSDWLKAALISGTVGGLYAFDQDIKDWVQDNRSSASDTIAEVAKPFGNGRYTLPSLGALYLYGHFSKDQKARRASLLSIESLIISGIFTQTIKYLGHRHRPNSGDAQNTWDGPSFSSSNLSFPSGHASSAFAVGTIIASEYENNMFIPPLAYGIATLTALSRVNDNAHWASDVFLGSAIGYFTAKTIVALHKKNKRKRITLVPVLNSRQTSILMFYQL